MHPRRPERWRTRFGGFVMQFGADALGGAVGVTDKAVYRWVAGETVPGLLTADRIVRASSGAVTFGDLVQHVREVRHGDGAAGAGAGAPALAGAAQDGHRRQ